MRRFLFLQGPISPFFAEVAAGLRALGHQVHRVNLNLGDKLFWRGPGAVDFPGTLAAWPAWIDRFLAEQAITDVFLSGEQRPYHKIAIAAAKARGISVVVTDFGYLRPDWITLERDGMGGNSLVPRDPAVIQEMALGLPLPDPARQFEDDFARRACWDIAYHTARLWPFGFRHYQNHQLLKPIWLYAALGLRLLRRRAETRRSLMRLRQQRAAGAPFWLFAMQLETDFSIRAYSPYPDMDTPLRETMASFARHAPERSGLLVKLHPLDPCVKNWPARIAAMARGCGLEGRVQVLPAGDLDEILAEARGLITVNSTAASRALILGKPIKLLGQSVFDLPGLAFQGPLDDYWRGASPPDHALRDALLKVLAHGFMLRGVFFAPIGRQVAVAATVARLHHNTINQVLAPLRA